MLAANLKQVLDIKFRHFIRFLEVVCNFRLFDFSHLFSFLIFFVRLHKKNTSLVLKVDGEQSHGIPPRCFLPVIGPSGLHGVPLLPVLMIPTFMAASLHYNKLSFFIIYHLTVRKVFPISFPPLSPFPFQVLPSSFSLGCFYPRCHSPLRAHADCSFIQNL